MVRIKPKWAEKLTLFLNDKYDSIKDAGEKLGIPRIYQYTSGKNKPSAKVLQKFQAAGLSLDWLNENEPGYGYYEEIDVKTVNEKEESNYIPDYEDLKSLIAEQTIDLNNLKNRLTKLEKENESLKDENEKLRVDLAAAIANSAKADALNKIRHAKNK